MDDEAVYLQAQAALLGNIPITYPNDHLPNPEDLPRKFTPFPVEVPPPPVANASQSLGTQDSITLTIKSLKPAATFNITVQPTDTIASIKEQLEREHTRAPHASDQRLLLKGKVLGDTKLLREYEVSDGAVLNLMVKPGITWTAQDRTPTATAATTPTSSSQTLEANPPPRRHARTPSEGRADQLPVPSLVLTESGGERSPPVPLSLDLSTIPPRPSSPSGDTTNYGNVISSTTFWEHLQTFLHKEFGNPADGDSAFESFLLASKGSLSVGDIAKIRDATGVTGMSGT